MVIEPGNDPQVVEASICIEFFFTEHLAACIQPGELNGWILTGVHATRHHKLPIGDKVTVLQVVPVAADALCCISMLPC